MTVGAPASFRNEMRGARDRLNPLKKGSAMRTDFLALIDWSREIWIVQHRDPTGKVVTESTDFPASTPSIVVCDQLLTERPGSRVFAKISSK
jgi:hypothetical protein